MATETLNDVTTTVAAAGKLTTTPRTPPATHVMATATMVAPSADPNFPANLNIHPLHLLGTAATDGADAHNQAEAIGRYGIAGRVWEASGPLLEYLTPGGAGDPACTLFTTPGPHRVLELGSGQALASLHLAARLRAEDTVVLTDLPNVVPLCQQSIDTWATEGEGSQQAEHANVVAQPLAWGEDASHLAKYGPFTHIILCDLVSCTHKWLHGDMTHTSRSTSPTSTRHCSGLYSRSPTRLAPWTRTSLVQKSSLHVGSCNSPPPAT